LKTKPEFADNKLINEQDIDDNVRQTNTNSDGDELNKFNNHNNKIDQRLNDISISFNKK
jgi:hypothetical protein